MNREQKESVIQELKNDFSQSQGTFVVGVKGMTVTQLQKLRKDLRAQGGKLKITKARLMKIATDDNKAIEALQPFFKEQIGVVFSKQEPSAIAKVLFNFAKKNEALSLVAGTLESQLLDAKTIGKIAQLPSREVLLAQVCGALNMVMVKFLLTMKAIEAKKQEQQ
jgi:large subunit ribosomal protein L10